MSQVYVVEPWNNFVPESCCECLISTCWTNARSVCCYMLCRQLYHVTYIKRISEKDPSCGITFKGQGSKTFQVACVVIVLLCSSLPVQTAVLNSLSSCNPTKTPLKFFYYLLCPFNIICQAMWCVRTSFMYGSIHLLNSECGKARCCSWLFTLFIVVCEINFKK